MVGIALTACQQVLDRLQADLKGAKPTPVTDAAPAVKASIDSAQVPQTTAKNQVLEPSTDSPAAPKPAVKPNTPPQIVVARPTEHKPATTAASKTDPAPAVTQAQKPTPTVSNRRAITQQVQTIDEDGNPLVESAGAKKTKPRVYIED